MPMLPGDLASCRDSNALPRCSRSNLLLLGGSVQLTGFPCYFFGGKKKLLSLLQQPAVPLGMWICSCPPRAGQE